MIYIYWVLGVLGVLGVWLAAHFFGWLSVRDPGWPFNWRIFLGPGAYFKWVNRDD